MKQMGEMLVLGKTGGTASVSAVGSLASEFGACRTNCFYTRRLACIEMFEGSSCHVKTTVLTRVIEM